MDNSNRVAQWSATQQKQSEAIELFDAEFGLFRQWLYANAGIQLADAKRTLVAGRLNKRLKELGMPSFRQYYDYLTRSGSAATEKQVALNLLTTNETFFFRENAHFEFVQRTLIPQWKGRSVRCWSAASSTGEEAYTLAMVLAEHHRGDWSVTGTDISSRVVEIATEGAYPLERSKNIPTRYLHEHCRKGIDDNAGTFRISKEIRQKVKFMLANLQQSQQALGAFDLIFLRNVMIYFDGPSKQRVLNHVIDRLKPEGILFIGHAESLNGITDEVKSLQPAIYQKLASG